MAHEDVILRGVEHLQDFRHRKLVETCSYVQNGTLYEDVHLTLAADASESDDDLGVIVNSRRVDFLASPSEFATKGLEKPMRGDRIIRTVGGEEVEYDVVSSGGEPAYREMSRYRLGWRIHAVIMRTETM